MNEQSPGTLSLPYNDDFYHFYLDDSYKSGRKYAGLMSSIFKIRSVVDLGCGRGTWLKAFRETGATRTLGLDGSWGSKEEMVDPSIDFVAADLNLPVDLADGERFDLAMSLEVAEHLEPASAQDFVASLTKLSDVVMFGAAFIKQGGTNHLNEQLPSYWANLFLENGYQPFDLFRPLFWGDPEISYWYQQNTFLYVKAESSLGATLAEKGHSRIANLAFMDCVHPMLYLETVDRTAAGLALLHAAKGAVPPSLKPLMRKVKRAVAGKAKPPA